MSKIKFFSILVLTIFSSVTMYITLEDTNTTQSNHNIEFFATDEDQTGPKSPVRDF